MGEILLPPYLWFANDNSTPDSKGLAGEVNIQPSISNTNQQHSTPVLRQRGLAGEIDIQPPKTRSNVQDSIYKFDKRWYASSELNISGPKDIVMYDPKYEGPKVKDLISGQTLKPIDDDSIFRPPEDEE